MDAILTLILLLAAGIAYFEWAKRRAIADKLRRYAQLAEPIIEYSRTPLDSEVDERVREHLEWLEKSGNTWHRDGKRLVYSFYYNAIASDGKSAHVGAFLSWNHYLISLGEFTRMVVNTFAADIEKHDPSAYAAYHLKQQQK